MKMISLRILGLLATSLFLSFRAIAAPEPEANNAKTTSSTIAAVTVYADRAQVTRTASIVLTPAPMRLAFPKLPGWLDEGSVRVSLTPADAGQILDVQVQRTFLARAGDEEIQKAENVVREFSDQIAALEDEKSVLDAESKHIDSIRIFSLEKLPRETALREIKPEEYAASLKFITTSLRDVVQARRDLEKKRRELQPELTARQRALDELRQRAQLEQRTILVTLKGGARSAELSIAYMLPGATWEPVHELRALSDGNQISLSSLGVVMQTTGEDWNDVALSLSTQKSTETMKIPELESLLVGAGKVPRLRVAGDDTFVQANRFWAAQNGIWFNMANPDQRKQQEFTVNQAAQLENQKKVEILFERVQQRGTTAHFLALAGQTIRTDGRPVHVPIGRAELAAHHRLLASPGLSLNAARLVDLTNSTKQPLLPGRVSLFMGGAFLGLTETEFVAPEEGFPIYVGVADHIKLSRTLDKKRSALVRGGTKTKMQVSFLVAVENLSLQAAAVQLTDRVPVSETEEVRVSSVRIQPEGKPDQKGLLRWDLNLGPKQTREFRVEYTLEYPNELPRRAAEIKSKASIELKSSIVPAPSSIGDQILDLERKF